VTRVQEEEEEEEGARQLDIILLQAPRAVGTSRSSHFKIKGTVLPPPPPPRAAPCCEMSTAGRYSSRGR